MKNKIYNLVEVFKENNNTYTSLIYDFTEQNSAVYIKNAFEKIFRDRTYKIEEVTLWQELEKVQQKD